MQSLGENSYVLALGAGAFLDAGEEITLHGNGKLLAVSGVFA